MTLQMANCCIFWLDGKSRIVSAAYYKYKAEAGNRLKMQDVKREFCFQRRSQAEDYTSGL
jgi:hypothetical protein